MKLDPELAAFVAAMPPPVSADAVPDGEYHVVRAAAHEYYALRPTSPDPAITEDDIIVPGGAGPDVRVRVYRPVGLAAPAAALLWVHGGGFSLGMIEADDWRCRDYARRAECVVISVEYRLAPEDPYPAGLDDCWTALTWTVAHADGLGIGESRVAVGGASAGGCLAAALTLLTRDREGPPLAFQLLVYPVLDDRLQSPSSRTNVDVPVFGRSAAIAAWRRYLRNVEGDVPEYAAPARASDLRGLPPAYLLAAEYDPLRDEGIDYALRLMQAAVPVELHVYPHTFHGFEAIGVQADIVRRASEEQARALRAALHTPAISAT